jgi:hypothetical protein
MNKAQFIFELAALFTFSCVHLPHYFALILVVGYNSPCPVRYVSLFAIQISGLFPLLDMLLPYEQETCWPWL